MADVSRSGCDLCGGKGYLVAPGKDFAVARECACVRDCAECQGQGFLIDVAEDGHKEARTCSCSELKRRIRLFNAAHIPANMALKGLDDYQDLSGNQSLVKLHVRRYLECFDPRTSKGLMFFGAPGVGKTHLMCAILRHIGLEQGIACRFVDFFQLLSDIKAGFDHGRASEDLLGPLTTVPVLGIDEIGKGRATEWEVSVLDQLVSMRYNRNLVILGSTNFAPEPEEWPEGVPSDAIPPVTLLSRVGDRIYSRLAEMCQFVIVEGPDFRRKSGLSLS